MRRLLILLALLLLALAGCAGTSTGTSVASPSPSPTPYEPPVYAYEVEGVATNATVTFATRTGQEQHSIDELSTEVTDDQRWEFEGPISFLYVSIQGGDEYTSVTCRIMMGDQVLAENSSDAAYGIAACQVA